MIRIMFRAAVSAAVAIPVVVGGGVATANAASGWQPTGSMSVAHRARTDSRGRFRVTLPAPPAGSPAMIHRLWWGTRSVSLPVVVTA